MFKKHGNFLLDCCEFRASRIPLNNVLYVCKKQQDISRSVVDTTLCLINVVIFDQ